MNEEYSIKLLKPIQVTKNGDFEEVYELVFTAPTMKDRKAVANLQQIIARAEKQEQFNMMASIDAKTIEDIQKSIDPQELEKVRQAKEDDKSGDALKEVILSSNEDLEDFYSRFDTLAKRTCIVLDGVNLTDVHIEQLNPKDYDKMCFGYIANFIQ